MEAIFIKAKAYYDLLFDFLALYSSKHPVSNAVFNKNLVTKIQVSLQKNYLAIVGMSDDEFSNPLHKEVFKIYWELVMDEVEKWLSGQKKTLKLSHLVPYYADLGSDYLESFYNTIKLYCEKLFKDENYKLITNGYNVYVYVDKKFDSETCLRSIFNVNVMYNDCR